MVRLWGPKIVEYYQTVDLEKNVARTALGKPEDHYVRGRKKKGLPATPKTNARPGH